MATSTVGPSKDYATVTAWEAAVQGTLSEIQIASVYKNTSDAVYTDQVTIDGSVTTSSFYMRVECAAGEEFNHDISSPVGVRWDNNTSGAHVFTIGDAYVELVGFGITNSSAGSSDEGIRINTGGTPLYCEKLSIYSLTAADCDGVYVGNMSVDLTMKDCTFIDIHRAGIHFQHYSGSAVTQVGTIVNCSFHGMGTTGGGTREGCAIGYRCTNSSSTLDVKVINCFNIKSAGSDTYDIRQTNSSSNGTETFTGDFNASEQANQAASGFPDDAGNSLFAKVAYRGSDLTVETGDYLVVVAWTDLHIVDEAGKTYTNALQVAGVGPTTDSDVTTTDIDGDTRSGTTCDIGADEIPVVADVTITGLQADANFSSVVGVIQETTITFTGLQADADFTSAIGVIQESTITFSGEQADASFSTAVGTIVESSITITGSGILGQFSAAVGVIVESSITITGETADSVFSSQNGVIQESTITFTGEAVNADFTTVVGVIEAGGDVTVTGVQADADFTTTVGVIQESTITIPGLQVDSVFSSAVGVIEAGGDVTIVGVAVEAAFSAALGTIEATTITLAGTSILAVFSCVVGTIQDGALVSDDIVFLVGRLDLDTDLRGALDLDSIVLKGKLDLDINLIGKIT